MACHSLVLGLAFVVAGAFGRSELQQDVPRAIEPTLILSFDNALEQQLRAGDGIRTHDNNVGNVVLCQLSYTRSAVSVSLVGSTRLKLLINPIAEAH